MTCPPCNHDCNQGRTCPARLARAFDYETAVEFGATTIQIGLDYKYVPGRAAVPQSPWSGGEPAEDGSVTWGPICWRDDDDKAAWVRADDRLRAVLIAALGGEEQLVEDLCAHAEGNAESAAMDRGDWLLHRSMEDCA